VIRSSFDVSDPEEEEDEGLLVFIRLMISP